MHTESKPLASAKILLFRHPHATLGQETKPEGNAIVVYDPKAFRDLRGLWRSAQKDQFLFRKLE